MKGKVLVVNAGSSSLKFSIYEMPDEIEIINGRFEKIGDDDSFYSIDYLGDKYKADYKMNNHSDAVDLMLKFLIDYHVINDFSEICAVSHRIVHGGEYYKDSVLIDEEVVENIKNLAVFARLHHPGHLAGIAACINKLPNASQVAVFDTSFHQTIPKKNYLYPLPIELYTNNMIRKYGAHGTSHKYITEVLQKMIGKDEVNSIICHIGNGASISLIENGRCIDTSMGLTPLDGLMMGTRCGTIDPSIIEHIAYIYGCDINHVIDILNKESGLKGITGVSDYRDVESLALKGDENAKMALEMYKDRIVKYIAEYYFKIKGNIDALVFTAGVGENSDRLRKAVIEDIGSVCGIALDDYANKNVKKMDNNGIVSTVDSNFIVAVIPTNEELMLAREAYNILTKSNNNSLILRKH